MTTTHPSAPPEPPLRRNRGRSILGVFGELLITVGALILLFVAWQLWWTDVVARRSFDDTRAELAQQWQADAGVTGDRSLPAERAEPGIAFALMYVPALGDAAWRVPILQGTSVDLLQRGLGHHAGSALPGEVGNVAIAGHRTTYGAPFGDIDRLQRGDQVIIETQNGWYVYELDRSEVIDANEGWVLDPVPGRPPDTTPSDELITIYACHPKFSAAQRFVWFGHLVDKYPRSVGTPAAITDRGET